MGGRADARPPLDCHAGSPASAAAGVAVGACLHVTSETAVLVRALRGGSGRRAVRVQSRATQGDVAEALAEAEVHAGGPDTWAAGVAAVVDRAPRITLDDGADLLGALHAARPDLLAGCSAGPRRRAAASLRLRALEAEGAGGARHRCQRGGAERAFNDRFGAGQSVLDGDRPRDQHPARRADGRGVGIRLDRPWRCLAGRRVRRIGDRL